MGSIGKAVFISLMAAAIPVPGFAQKTQTTETAQEFLRVTAVNLPSSFDNNMVRNDKSSMSIVGIIENDECKSKIKIDRDYEYYSYGEWMSQKDSYESVIAWSGMASVSRSQNGITLMWTGGALRITYPTVDLATRAAFAMEFLRTQCDPTADLAF